jgi:DNA-binding response OmpR family regulator
MENPLRVLVLDDDPSLIRTIRLALILEGFEIETASDGLEGLDLAEKFSFDLILLDLQMPKMDGRAFYRELRKRGHATPVIVLSAYGAENARNELEANGAIAKPFDPDVLVEVIRRTLATSPIGSGPG